MPAALSSTVAQYSIRIGSILIFITGSFKTAEKVEMDSEQLLHLAMNQEVELGASEWQGALRNELPLNCKSA